MNGGSALRRCNVWSVHGICMTGVWNVLGICLNEYECVKNVLCQDGVSKTSGRSHIVTISYCYHPFCVHSETDKLD